MTTRENAQALDAQLTQCLTVVNGLLYGETFGATELVSVRVYLSMAIGMTAGFAPIQSAYNTFAYAEAVAGASTVDELASVQRAIFDGAYAHLNAALYA